MIELVSAQPDMKRVRRNRARADLTRWLRYTSPAPSPRDVQEMIDWVDELLAENRGLKGDLLDSIERNIVRTPGPHGGQGKGIRGKAACRRCGVPYDGVTAHGPGFCEMKP